IFKALDGTVQGAGAAEMTMDLEREVTRARAAPALALTRAYDSLGWPEGAKAIPAAPEFRFFSSNHSPVRIIKIKKNSGDETKTSPTLVNFFYR
ncbi:hypothetical protein GE061_000180, partial [Apolygus lucorum]